MEKTHRKDLFIHLIRHLLAGDTQARATEKLSECINAARLTGKKAKFSLHLTIKPVGQNGQLEIRDDIGATVPELDHGVTLCWDTDDGNVTLTHPKQQNLDLQVIPDPDDELRDAE